MFSLSVTSCFKIENTLIVFVEVCSSADQVECGLGPCIAATAWCDGEWDCVDGSDEVRGCRKFIYSTINLYILDLHVW